MLYIDDPQKKSKFLRKNLESESDIRDMLKPPKSKTAAELVSKNNITVNFSIVIGFIYNILFHSIV